MKLTELHGKRKMKKSDLRTLRLTSRIKQSERKILGSNVKLMKNSIEDKKKSESRTKKPANGIWSNSESARRT